MSKIEILHLTTDSKISGAEKLLIALADNYDRNTFEFSFCTLKKEGSLHLELRKRNCKVFSLGLTGILGVFPAIPRLIRIIKKEKIDILHTHLIHASFLGQLVAKLLDLKAAIMTRHYSDFTYLYKGSLIRLLDKISLCLASKIIAISNACKAILIEREKIIENKITVVHNGIDLNVFNVAFKNSKVKKSDFNIAQDTKIIAQIGTFHPRKGHRYLLKSLPKIKERHKDFKLLIIGDGYIKPGLIKLCAELRIEDKVIFLGYRQDVPELLSVVDILVQPSLEEGFGITLLEAMAAEKLVIASKVGGITEIIEDGISGFLVSPADTKDLTDRLNHVLDNFENFNDIRKNARKRVESDFSIKMMVKGYQDIYADSLK